MFSFSSIPIRTIPNSQGKVFLTFDDGPDPRVTPALLEILADYDVEATFFLVGQQAEKYSFLAKEIIRLGHTVGNHTWDHNYANYFRGEKHLTEWVDQSRRKLESILGTRTIGFRPPAGVVTPPLIRSVQRLETPLILWNHRFFDTRFKFTKDKALRAGEKTAVGDILLLHDRNNRHSESLLTNLRVLLDSLHARNLHASSINAQQK